MAALIAQLAKDTKKPHRDNPDVLDIFDQMVKDGGLHINVPGGTPINGRNASGGSGLSHMERGVRTTFIYLMPGARGRTATLYEYADTGIHEMIHQMAKNTMYLEPEVIKAALALGVRKLTGKDSLDAYIKHYCIPKEFH